MNFIDAVKTCFIKYVDFSGRASRSEFWYFVLFVFIIQTCADILDAAIVGKSFWSYEDLYGTVSLIFNVLIFLPSVAVSFRRLHDINKSGWWNLISFTVVGLIPLIYWCAKESDKNSNRFGDSNLDIAEENNVIKTPKWIIYFLIPVASFVLIAGISSLFLLKTGIILEAKVYKGNELFEKHKVSLINHNIIDKNDEILYFYSEGFLSILDGGQLITNDKLISYLKNEDQFLEIYEMKVKNIKEIELLEEGSFLSDGVYKIIGNKNSEYEFITILLPNDAGGDKDFINEINKRIK